MEWVAFGHLPLRVMVSKGKCSHLLRAAVSAKEAKHGDKKK